MMVSAKTLLAVSLCVVAVETFFLAVAYDWSSSMKYMSKFVWGDLPHSLPRNVGCQTGGMEGAGNCTDGLQDTPGPTIHGWSNNTNGTLSSINMSHGYNQSEETQNTTVSKVEPQPLDVYLEQRAIRVKEVNCQKLFQGDQNALREANALERKRVPVPTDNQIHELASNCSHFVNQYRFLLRPLTRLEEEFSIAYSLITFKQASQVVDLLRAIYRPQNWYCVHVDHKASPSFRKAMEAVSGCFPNVFVASRAIDVRWGFYTVLEPELVCMEDLWRNSTWKYFINLTGQEFPLKTNYELVRILSAFQGANNVDASVPARRFVNYRWKKALPAPHKISLYKGDVHIAVTRGFVDYVIHSPIALDFREWCKKTRHPDEHFFNSLNHNPHLRVPGGTKGRSGHSELVSPSVARFKVWKGGPCPGRKIVRQICILNVLDLPRLRASDLMFANKFYADHSRLALQCLAEELHNRTREQTLGRLDFNATSYGQLSFVKNRLS